MFKSIATRLVPCLLFSALGLNSWCFAEINENGPGKAIVDIYEAYVPEGYDINSNVEVVLNVFEPDDCHPWSGALVTQVSPSIHEVRALLKVLPGLCFSKISAKTKLVSLGHLIAGKHEVRFFKKDGTYITKELFIMD